jgi:hypothetical protein
VKPLSLVATLAFSLGVARGNSVAPFDAPDAIDIAGFVTDGARNPVPDAEVFLQAGGAVSAATRMSRTGPDGKFSFTYSGAGAVVLTIRRLGFRPYSRSLLADTLSASRPLHIILDATALTLDTVRVEAVESSRMREFYQRKRIHASGHFLERSEIERRRPAYSSELMRSFPGFLVRPSPRGGNIVRIRGCRPGLWIDGVQAQNAEIDEITRPDEIAGLEVYSSASTMPPQYRDRAGRDCGAIFVWTRMD